jgi:hypothetical protein
MCLSSLPLTGNGCATKEELLGAYFYTVYVLLKNADDYFFIHNFRTKCVHVTATDLEVPGSIPGHYKKKLTGLERGPLSLVSTTEELFGRNSSGAGLEIREYGRRDPSR